MSNAQVQFPIILPVILELTKYDRSNCVVIITVITYNTTPRSNHQKYVVLQGLTRTNYFLSILDNSLKYSFRIISIMLSLSSYFSREDQGLFVAAHVHVYVIYESRQSVGRVGP